LKFDYYDSAVFKEILSESYKLDLYKYNNEISYFESKYKFKKTKFNLPFQFYQPKDYFEEKGIKNFITLLKERDFAYFHSIGKIDSLEGTKVAKNPILSLTKDTHPENNYSRRTKEYIKNYSKYMKENDINISITKNTQDLKRFYKHLAKSYTRKHRMIFQPYEIYKNLFNDQGFLIIATTSEKLLGGGFFIKDSKTLHYNWGSYENLNKFSTATSILDFSIKYAWENNYDYFDFGSTPLNDSNLLFSKTKFGADPLDVYLYSNFEKRNIDLNDHYKTLRFIFSLNPISINRIISKIVVPYLV
tara:strand:+ start:834 stop:1742 length:909 start_codon:yes stop_codon:yes gene_type:complete